MVGEQVTPKVRLEIGVCLRTLKVRGRAADPRRRAG
jgi:hypothetical protein